MRLGHILSKSALFQCAFALLFSLSGSSALADEQLQTEQMAKIESFVFSVDADIEYEPNFSLIPSNDDGNIVRIYALAPLYIEQPFIQLCVKRPTIRAPPSVL